MFERFIDSEKENCSLAPGEHYEKFVELSSGQYTIMACPKYIDKYNERMGYVHLEIFTEDGQRVASDEGNIPGCCHIILAWSMKLKFKVTRSNSEIQNILHYEVKSMPSMFRRPFSF